jgi:hypothetical protein
MVPAADLDLAGEADGADVDAVDVRRMDVHRHHLQPGYPVPHGDPCRIETVRRRLTLAV